MYISGVAPGSTENGEDLPLINLSLSSGGTRWQTTKDFQVYLTKKKCKQHLPILHIYIYKTVGHMFADLWMLFKANKLVNRRDDLLEELETVHINMKIYMDWDRDRDKDTDTDADTEMDMDIQRLDIGYQ
jgi:hypothetical protein